MTATELAERIREVRNTLGRSQREQAGRVLMQTTQYRRYETGGHGPTVRLMKVLNDLGGRIVFTRNGNGLTNDTTQKFLDEVELPTQDLTHLALASFDQAYVGMYQQIDIAEELGVELPDTYTNDIRFLLRSTAFNKLSLDERIHAGLALLKQAEHSDATLSKIGRLAFEESRQLTPRGEAAQ